jgi:hypothetical protein
MSRVLFDQHRLVSRPRPDLVPDSSRRLPHAFIIPADSLRIHSWFRPLYPVLFCSVRSRHPPPHVSPLLSIASDPRVMTDSITIA